uniref:ATP synthase subunit a n=1 Tax=Batrachomoeus trispinosus TaxID=262770 RepID=Q5GMA2_9TELE|nr:ATPase subunit 6 [Batrachomoeus trispinosus]
MLVNLFNQFEPPIMLNLPLISLAVIFPLILLTLKQARWLNNRISQLQMSSIKHFITHLMTPVAPTGHKWSLILASLMTLLVVMNSTGLLPYTFTPTTHLSINWGLAFSFWLATLITGFYNNPTQAFGHMLPKNTPNFLIPLLIIIETASQLVRPLALGVRLTANLTAGHLLIHLISSTLMQSATSIPLLFICLFPLLPLLSLLEVAMAIIQAYVFVLLLSLYLQENI